MFGVDTDRRVRVQVQGQSWISRAVGSLIFADKFLVPSSLVDQLSEGILLLGIAGWLKEELAYELDRKDNDAHTKRNRTDESRVKTKQNRSDGNSH